MTIKIEGIYIEDVIANQTKECLMSLNKWEKFEIFEYSNDKYKKIKICNIDLLKDICESKITPDYLVLKGFGKLEGHWTEYHFYKANIKIETLEK